MFDQELLDNKMFAFTHVLCQHFYYASDMCKNTYLSKEI